MRELILLKALALGALGYTYIIWHFAAEGFNLDINIVNTIFLFTGIFLHNFPAFQIVTLFMRLAHREGFPRQNAFFYYGPEQ